MQTQSQGTPGLPPPGLEVMMAWVWAGGIAADLATSCGSDSHWVTDSATEQWWPVVPTTRGVPPGLRGSHPEEGGAWHHSEEPDSGLSPRLTPGSELDPVGPERYSPGPLDGPCGHYQREESAAQRGQSSRQSHNGQGYLAPSLDSHSHNLLSFSKRFVEVKHRQEKGPRP